ncbi:MAG: SDR family NAD(P)-dependent oxidoreductase [Lentimicrobium sp.]|jgi:short-subunit dehydrogenase|nr:SDR family NAD(P)-dependent oxidoreductase [Lentimicrobium sp.]
MDFNQKTIWITGAASGMGQALAVELADKNMHLIISDRDEAGLNNTAGLIEARGSKASPYVLDMSDQLAIQSVARSVLSSIDRLDGLYQFAGISQRSLVVETPIENDRKIMEINFFGVIGLAKAVLSSMIETGGGQLCVTSSLVGKFGFPFRSAYSASKHALHGYFESLRAENSKYNIRVSILIPGRIQTNISKFAIDKHGQEYGKMDPGQANGITAEKAARQILRGLRKEKKEIHVGGMELFMLQIRRFFPALLYKLATRIKPV